MRAIPFDKRNSHPEEDLQIACVQFFTFRWKKYAPLLMHLSNALPFMGNNRKAYFGKLKRLTNMGLRKGAPDLFLAVNNGIYCGLFIEMKDKGKKRSPEQIAMMEDLEHAGYKCITCDCFEDFNYGVDNYLRAVSDRAA